MTGTIILSYSLLELSLLNSFHKRWFSLLCLGVQRVLITTSAVYRQHAFGEHSSLPAISLYIIIYVFLKNSLSF